MISKIRSLLPLIVVIVISFTTILPLFINGFFPMHDDTQPARVYEMSQALRDGQFPVRWVGNLGYGYGYPLFNFYAPLPYYIGALFHLMGATAINATKMMMGLGMVTAGMTMFLLVIIITRNYGAAGIAATAYLLAPYHSVLLYIRGAVGELFAYSFLPIPFLGWTLILQKRYKRGIIVSSIGLFLVFTSHTVSAFTTLYLAVFFLSVTFAFSVLRKLSPIIPLTIGVTLFWGILLAAFFIIPAYSEKQFTSVAALTEVGSDFRSHFVSLLQLWDSPWGFAGSAKGLEDGMSFRIGKLHLIAGVCALFTLLYQFKRRKLSEFHLLWVMGCGLWVVGSVFMMLSISKPFWEILPNFAFIQYPWRFLSMTLLGLCILIALGIRYSPIRFNTYLIVLIAGAIVLVNQKLFSPQYIFESNDSMYTSTANLRGKLSKISDEYLPDNFRRDQYSGNMRWKSASGLVVSPTYNELNHQSNYRQFEVFVPTSGMYTAPLTYFPSWRAHVEDTERQIKEHEGLVSLELQQGSQRVEFFLEQTPVEKLSNLISLLSIILLVYVSLFLKKRRHEETLS